MALLGALALLSACSLIYASDLNGARDVDVADATPSAGDGGVVADASDGGGDASNDAQTKRGGCSSYQPTPKFCNDFDLDPSPSTGWDLVSTESGKVSLDSTLAWSSPRSALITQVGPRGCKYTRFEKQLVGVGSKRATVAFRFRPSSPWKGNYTVLALSFEQPSQYCSPLLYLNANTDQTAIGETLVNVQFNKPQQDDVRSFKGAPKVDQWNEITLTMTAGMNGAGADLTVRIAPEDGTAPVESTETFAQCAVGGELGLYVGFHCSGGPAEIRFDDVRVDWE